MLLTDRGPCISRPDGIEVARLDERGDSGPVLRPGRCPANSAFFQFRAMGLMVRSMLLLSISILPIRDRKVTIWAALSKLHVLRSIAVALSTRPTTTSMNRDGSVGKSRKNRRMVRSGLVGVITAVAFWSGTAGTYATQQISTGSVDVSTKAILDSLTTESKCQILADAARDENQAVITVGANFILMSIMDQSTVIRNEFGVKEMRELYRQTFAGCADHPDEPISSQARVAFQSVLHDINEPGYRDSPGLDDVSVPANVQSASAKLLSILPDGPTVSEAKLTMKERDTSKPGRETVFLIKPTRGGPTRVSEIYKYFTMDREYVGPVQLKSKDNQRGMYGPSEDKRLTITTGLVLSASTWAADAFFAFETEMSGGTKPSKASCKIGQSIEANTLHPSLAGRAWPLACDYSDSKSNGYYVEELRYFLRTHSEWQDGAYDYSIDSAEITR